MQKNLPDKTALRAEKIGIAALDTVVTVPTNTAV
jgi:hypothetical protein